MRACITLLANSYELDLPLIGMQWSFQPSTPHFPSPSFLCTLLLTGGSSVHKRDTTPHLGTWPISAATDLQVALTGSGPAENRKPLPSAPCAIPRHRAAKHSAAEEAPAFPHMLPNTAFAMPQLSIWLTCQTTRDEETRVLLFIIFTGLAT